MKGCLSLIIKIIIGVLVFFGLKYLGIIDLIQEKLSQRVVSQEQLIEKSHDIIDLSQIDDEYTIDKSLKILDNRIILVQHNVSGQKMLMFELKNNDVLTKQDIKSENIQEKIDELLKKYKTKLLRFDKIDVIKQGNFNGIEQVIPYVKIKAEVSNLPIKDMEGIVGVAQVSNNRNLVIISINEKNKYSQIITESFFSKIKKSTRNE